MINPQQFCTDLYRVVDNEDLVSLADYLADDVEFRIANMPSVIGKNNVIDANQQFFSSIKNMRHSLQNIYMQNGDIFCHGSVEYLRLDDSSHHAYFSTLLKFEQNKITKYFVFADLSNL